MPKPCYSSDELPSPAWQKLFDMKEIEKILQSTARAGKAISYSEILWLLGYNFSRPKMRALCAALSEVDARARRKSQPELAILVVRALDGIPGAGWWSDKNKENDYHGPREGPQAAAYIQKRQAKVFRYWQKRPK